MVHLHKRKYYKPRRTPRESDFKTLFRFEEENVVWLADHFLGADPEIRGAALSPVQKMKLFLRYCVNSGFQSGIPEELGWDSGYGIMPCLMTPYPNPHEEYQRAFNRLLTSERVVIEHTFGQLTRQFPILKYGCRVKFTSISKVIIACTVLHNIAKQLGDADFQEDEDEEEQDLRHIDAIRAQGQERREELAHLITNNNVGL
ncbi:hypothetical protein NQ314_001311 [Rhamnusium bicolor]|uniref:DDE Tnp4 domain-containing protein n=1 Tax=Rhamnusium bicolor TaxID=1586634 RepID=A0AAV8ZU56_9CUCU|nr:hypothetical protein NQ314_001311 [Rhamnusium bicolor]